MVCAWVKLNLSAATEVVEDQERWEMFSVGKQDEQMRHSLDTS